MAVIELTLLGGFGARWSGGQIIDLPGQKDRALLAILAFHRGSSFTRDKLVGLLWSDRAEKQARDSLKHSLNDLRRRLHPAGEPIILTDRHTVTLDPAAVAVDVAAFEQLLSDHTPETLERAVALYQGDLLDGFAVQDPGFEDWLAGERQRLRRSVEEALTKLMEHSMVPAAKDRAAKAARHLLLLDPLREVACRILMQLEADRGHASQALKIYEMLRGKLHRELGVKPEPATIKLYETIRLRRGVVTPAASDLSPTELTAGAAPMGAELSPPPKRLIAVLPFQNLSGDPEQEYFADGITEDIIIDLSKVSALNVLSRSTTFTFKGRAVDVSQIARQLGVGYVVEGSVRRAGGRVRITAQLIDADKDSHLWAERYDRDLSDIFALQDEISQAIVAALKLKLLPRERQAIENRSTDNPEAYRLYLLARYYRAQYTIRFQEIALRFCRRALEIDPSYARAWALLGLCQASLYQRGRSADSGLVAAEKALSLDPSLADAHATKGRALAEAGKPDIGLIAHEESLRLEPDSYDVRMGFAQTLMLLGRDEEAVIHYERAAQLVETDYLSVSMAAWCYFALGREAEHKAASRRALGREEREVALRPDNGHALALGACELADLGEHERAKEWASRSLTIDPDDVVSRYNIACAMAIMNESDRALDLLEAYARDMPLARINRIKQDASLNSLRRHPRFQALVTQAEARWAAAQRRAGAI